MQTTEDHRAVFANAIEGGWQARPLSRYKLKDMPTLPWSDMQLSRDQLRQISRDENISIEIAVAAIMAWGGARYPSARSLWDGRSLWITALQEVRSGQRSRQESYDLLSRLHASGTLMGAGPAFFTKMLWFLPPSQDAFIMDQWTARSMKLLNPDAAPKMDGVRVSPRNRGIDYERFCAAIENLATSLSISGEECEKRMFGQGGRNPTMWRSYVKAHS